jgi:hypothetical protein
MVQITEKTHYLISEDKLSDLLTGLASFGSSESLSGTQQQRKARMWASLIMFLENCSAERRAEIETEMTAKNIPLPTRQAS